MLPSLEVIRSNLSKEELKYFDVKKVEIKDNLYSNLNLKTFTRFFIGTTEGVAAALATFIVAVNFSK